MDKMNSEYSVDATKYETKDDMYKYYNINACLLYTSDAADE